jgi:hypothetical protein
LTGDKAPAIASAAVTFRRRDLALKPQDKRDLSTTICPR